jgi:glycosyltransferase involved in cell wall biosynthesis
MPIPELINRIQTVSAPVPRVLVVYRFQPNTADGGSAYERMAIEVLSNFCKVEAHAIILANSRLSKYVRVPAEALRLHNAVTNSPEFQISVETMDASLLPTRRPPKRVSIIHHCGFSRDRLYALFERFLLARLQTVDRIVTVSRYWESRLREMGFRDVRMIYNAFPIEDFEFEEEEIDRFRKRYDLGGKPIIYLGSYGKHKGTLQTIEYLSSLDVHLVVSGDPSRSVPGAHQLRLHRKDYLRLLRASSVAITMSQFDEGWCRTAHEAMLCGTPVIGSGRGGMGELLQDGGQIICQQFGELSKIVRDVVSQPDWRRSLGDAGQRFAKQFTVRRMYQGWKDLIETLQD